MVMNGSSIRAVIRLRAFSVCSTRQWTNCRWIYCCDTDGDVVTLGSVSIAATRHRYVYSHTSRRLMTWFSLSHDKTYCGSWKTSTWTNTGNMDISVGRHDPAHPAIRTRCWSYHDLFSSGNESVSLFDSITAGKSSIGCQSSKSRSF